MVLEKQRKIKERRKKRNTVEQRVSRKVHAHTPKKKKKEEQPQKPR